MFSVRSTSRRRDWRSSALRATFVVLGGVVVFRLFILQVVSAGYYQQLSSNQHGFYEELFASRGDIFVRDWVDGKEYLAATTERRALVYADVRHVENAEATAKALATILRIPIQLTVPDPASAALPEATEYETLLARLSKKDDPYEPLARDIDEDTAERVKDANLAGIGISYEEARFYPEKNIGGHIFGFLGVDSEGTKIGQYGIEGFEQDFLAGVNGFIESQADTAGQWIGVGTRTLSSAVDGGDLLLTIDRTIQYTACKYLAEGVREFDADGGSIVILEPSTGRVIAMCNTPDYDPNDYGNVESISVFNNGAIMSSYEPGSVMKPLVMAAAIDSGAIAPTTTFDDPGEVQVDDRTIRNSDLKAHGIQTMTQVLENSLNTGMVFVMRKMGGEKMATYLENFGLGKVTGIELDTEVPGTLESLKDGAEIYYATASYGQGVTTTTLQMASAYAALANGGMLMQPYIIEERRYDGGAVVPTTPRAVRQVISQKTATTIGAMMVSVIENGHGSRAAVPGYYIAGKTGTAQVASSEGGYQTDHTIATFAGFGPVENPQFAMVVTLDRPRSTEWAESSSALIFHNVAEFLLEYLQVAPVRDI
ncbi:MAG: penicillin-binding protein 2 [Patescibacteria group bacterium]